MMMIMKDDNDVNRSDHIDNIIIVMTLIVIIVMYDLML